MGGPSSNSHPSSRSHGHGHGASASSSATTARDGGSSHSPCMKVVVRVRPVNEKERAARNHRIVLKPMDEHIVLFDPLEASAIASSSSSSSLSSSGSAAPSLMSHNNTRRARDQRFMFDRVFDEHTSQSEVFSGSAREVLDSVVEGYHATVFAYGATSSGKTHPMIGGR